MVINIGVIILQLRKEKQLTQEQLAEILGVSTTAVCKWETGSSHPDIELLPVIADFFGTSVDRLLGYDMNKQDSDVNELLQAGGGLIHDKEKTKEALAYYSKLAYRYPNHFYVLLWYAYVKGVAGDKSDDALFIKTMKNDQEELLRKAGILAANMSRIEQEKVIWDTFVFHIKHKEFEKAEQILMNIPSVHNFIDSDTGRFWLEAHRGDRERAEHMYYEVLNMMHRDVMVFARHYVFQDRPTLLIQHNNKMIQVYTLFMDDFAKKPWWPLAFLYESNAIAYYRLGEKDKAFNELKKFTESVAHMPDISKSCRNVVKKFTLGEYFYVVHNVEEEEEAYAFIKNSYENL